MELLVANLTKCEKLEVIMQSIHSLKLSQDALQQEPVVVFEVESFENQMSVYSYLGDAQIDGYQVSLSNEKLGPAQQCVSSGALFFNSPMNFYDFKMRRPLSFKTSFRFSISTLATPIYFGDGISFIISPIISLGDSPFAYPKIFFGVAIDTNMDPFGTPSEIYVRLFDNSLSSFASAKFIENIRSGEEYTCWIEFEGISKVIMLYLDIGLIRPVEPLLVTRVDALDTYLSSNNGNYFVGLTASSNGCTEVYQIYSWAFMIEKKKQVEEEVNLEQKTMELYRAYTQNSILATLAVIASVVAIVVGASLCLDQEKQKMKV